MPRVGFKPRVSVLERTKAFDASDRGATAIACNPTGLHARHTTQRQENSERDISQLYGGSPACPPWLSPWEAPQSHHGSNVSFSIVLSERNYAFFFSVPTPFDLQAVYIHSANLCEDWVVWLGEGHSVLPFRSY
jgi:hypothetical protein